MIELLAFTYLPPIHAVFHTFEPAVIVMARTVTVRFDANVDVDLISGHEPVLSMTPFFCVQVPERIVQSELAGLLLRLSTIDTPVQFVSSSLNWKPSVPISMPSSVHLVFVGNPHAARSF